MQDVKEIDSTFLCASNLMICSPSSAYQHLSWAELLAISPDFRVGHTKVYHISPVAQAWACYRLVYFDAENELCLLKFLW